MASITLYKWRLTLVSGFHHLVQVEVHHKSAVQGAVRECVCLQVQSVTGTSMLDGGGREGNIKSQVLSKWRGHY